MYDTALATVQLTMDAAKAYGRDDLAYRLSHVADRLRDPAVRVLVVGEFKQGKSSLINALVNAPVCPVDDDVATSAPTAIRYAEEPWATVTYEPDDPSSEPAPEAIELDALPLYVAEGGNPGNRRRVRIVEVGLPRRILSQGVVLIDTPGVGGLGSAHTATTVAALPMADALLFLTDASQELTAPELEFLATARDACPNIAFVLTKIDFYPEWRRIRDIDAAHLERLGMDVPILTTSATLRRKAIESKDRALNLESGYPYLAEHLATVASGDANRSIKTAVADLHGAVDQLRSAFVAEKETLEHPDDASAVVARFTQAKAKAEELRSKAAKWQVTLNDGIADLTADIDHVLRARMRLTTREAEATIDEQDPAEIWDEFEQWLQRRVSHDLAQTYLELSARADELSERVAGHFDDGVESIRIEPDATDALQTAAAIETRKRIEDESPSIGGKGLIAMRGSYGGFLMFGMIARMAGLAMLNPATAVIGVLMGTKAVRDEKRRRLTMRRQQAKITTRQYIDDATFAIAKETRDTLRQVQRHLRDHYQGRAEEMNRSISESLQAAKGAMKIDTEQRTRRLRDVVAELQRLDGLRQRIDALEGSTEGKPT